MFISKLFILVDIIKTHCFSPTIPLNEFFLGREWEEQGREQEGEGKELVPQGPACSGHFQVMAVSWSHRFTNMVLIE